jgi:hypothetical protein
MKRTPTLSLDVDFLYRRNYPSIGKYLNLLSLIIKLIGKYFELSFFRAIGYFRELPNLALGTTTSLSLLLLLIMLAISTF